MVAETNPAVYLATVLAAVELDLPVVLANPEWGMAERWQAAAQLTPGLWLGSKAVRWPAIKASCRFEAKRWRGAILIPTGGTGGRVRWAVHSWATLQYAARAWDEFMETEKSVHVSTLPPWHVSGLMPMVRAIETGGTLWLERWKALEAGQPPKVTPQRAVISLVPTQLQRLLRHRQVVRWLAQCHAVMLGGAAPSAALLERARKLRLPIALAYGMTETAAMVAGQRPRDFLAGLPACVTPLPHAKIWVGGEAGQPLRAGKQGRVWIQAQSLFHGYYPARQPQDSWATEDWGVMSRDGLCLRGRSDGVIITGGEKVHPREVEQQILATGLVADVRVIGLPDAVWGERVVALYTGKRQQYKKLRTALAGRLARHALPKTWQWTEKLPGGKTIR